jgi:hypothetical protein
MLRVSFGGDGGLVLGTYKAALPVSNIDTLHMQQQWDFSGQIASLEWNMERSGLLATAGTAAH